MALVAGIDSSTQSCKVLICDADTGDFGALGVRCRIPAARRSTRSGGGPPSRVPSTAAGGLDDVAAVSVGAQQHGMVCLDDRRIRGP